MGPRGASAGRRSVGRQDGWHNDLGRSAVGTLRGHGIDTKAIQFAGDRMGLYLVTSGAGMRATEVIYDRAWSSFAEAPVSAWAWNTPPPSTISFHHRVLREAGLIWSEKRGVQVINRVRAEDLEARFPGLLDLIIRHHSV